MIRIVDVGFSASPTIRPNPGRELSAAYAAIAITGPGLSQLRAKMLQARTMRSLYFVRER
jgi:hypothetical protein